MKFISNHKKSVTAFLGIFTSLMFVVFIAKSSDVSLFVYILPVLILTIILAFFVEVVTKLQSVVVKKSTPKVVETIKTSNYENTIELTKSTAFYSKVYNMDLINECERQFIAVDVETTGFNAKYDRMIEISAVVYEKFKVVNTFSTLINPSMHIPSSATNVNNITDKMVKEAPLESEAMKEFAKFLGNFLFDGSTFVAHNASFDFKFILAAFARNGISANINIVDTLAFARFSELDVCDNKLQTLAEYFNVVQSNAHRAEDDALACGCIFVNLLEMRKKPLMDTLNGLSPLERAVCLWVKSKLADADRDIKILSFKASKYLIADYFYQFIKFNVRAKSPYLLTELGIDAGELKVAPAIKSEGENCQRVFFTTVSDLDVLFPYFLSQYDKAFDATKQYINSYDSSLRSVARAVNSEISM